MIAAINVSPLDLPLRNVLEWLPDYLRVGSWKLGDFNYARLEPDTDITRIPRGLLDGREALLLSWEDFRYLANHVWQIHDAEFFCHTHDSDKAILTIACYSSWEFHSNDEELLMEICLRADNAGQTCQWKGMPQ